MDFRCVRTASAPRHGFSSARAIQREQHNINNTRGIILCWSPDSTTHPPTLSLFQLVLILFCINSPGRLGNTVVVLCPRVVTPPACFYIAFIIWLDL